MSKLSFSHNLKQNELSLKNVGWKWLKSLFRKQMLSKSVSPEIKFTGIKPENFVIVLVFILSTFLVLTIYVVDLTIVQGQQLYTRSVENHLRKIVEYPNRGIIETSDNVVVAKNESAVKLFLDINAIETNGAIDSAKLKKCSASIEDLLGDNWKNLILSTQSEDKDFSNIL